jgi:hypothetical protein
MNSNWPIPAQGFADSAKSSGQTAWAGPCQWHGVRVYGAVTAAGTCAVSRTLRRGKVGMGSTSRARPTHLARWEAAALTKMTVRHEAAEGRRRGDVSQWRLLCGGRRRYPGGPTGQRRRGVRRGQPMEDGRGSGRCSL